MTNNKLPDDRMSEKNWKLLLASIRCGIVTYKRYLDLSDAGVEINFYGDEVYDFVIDTILHCFDAEHIWYELTGEEREKELEIAKREGVKPELIIEEIRIKDTVQYKSFLWEDFFDKIGDYAFEVQRSIITIDDAVNECAHRIYHDLYSNYGFIPED